MIDKLARRFLEEIPGIKGALIIGSAAYGLEKPDSDIDMMLVSSDMRATLASEKLKELDRNEGIRDLEERAKQVSDSHCFKGHSAGIYWSPAIYTPSAFQDIVDLKARELSYTRNISNGGINIELFDFFRRATQYTIRNAQLGEQHFLAFEPICIDDGTLHFGPAPDALLKSPNIVYDPSGIMAAHLMHFWDRVYDRLSREAENPGELMATGKLPVIKKQGLPQEVYDHIVRELQEAKARH